MELRHGCHIYKKELQSDQIHTEKGSLRVPATQSHVLRGRTEGTEVVLLEEEKK